MASEGYGKLPDDVWEAAKVIWENSATISDRELLARLQEIFGEKAPKSSGTISKRRKSEKWEKNKILGGSAKEAGKEAPNKNAEATKKNGSKKKQNESQNPTNTKDDNKEADAESVEAHGSTNVILWQQTQERIYAQAEKLILDNQQKTDIIIKHRKRIRQAGELWETNAKLLQALKGLNPNEDGETIKQILVSAESISRTLTALTMSQKVLFEQEMLVCGIKWEDFEMSEQDRRMEGMKALEGIYEEAQRKRDELQQAMQKRLPEFENLTLDDAEFGESDYAAVYEDEDDEDDEDDF